MTEPIDELLEWLHTFDDLQFSCNHRNVIEKIWQIKSKQKLLIPLVGNSTSLKEILVDFGIVVKNSEGQELELLADAYIVYDRIKDEKE